MKTVVVNWYDWYHGVDQQVEWKSLEGGEVVLHCNEDTCVVNAVHNRYEVIGAKKDLIDKHMTSSNVDVKVASSQRRILGLTGSFLLVSTEKASEGTQYTDTALVEAVCLFTGSIRSLHIPQSVESIACSEAHVLLCTVQQVFSFGYGDCGQLGLGNDVLTTEAPLPISLPPGEYPCCISTASEHSAIITRPYGALYTFGNCTYSRLGHVALEQNVYEPRLVEALLGVGQLLPNGTTTGLDMVACGKWHTLAASRETSDVYGWGWNKFAQLGSDFELFSERKDAMIGEPQRLSFLDDILGDVDQAGNCIRKLVAGTRFSAVLTAGGKLITIGDLKSCQGVPGITKSSNWWNSQYCMGSAFRAVQPISAAIVQVDEEVLDFQCSQHSHVKLINQTHE